MTSRGSRHIVLFASLALLLAGCASSPDRVWYWPHLTPHVSESTPRAEYNRAVFDYAWKITDRNFYDATFGGHDWAALREKYRPAAESAKNDADLYEQINAMLRQLGSSHLEAAAPDAVRIRKKAREADVSLLGYLPLRLPGLIEPVVYEVTPGGPADVAGVKRGWQQIGIVIRDDPDAPLREGEIVRCMFYDEHDAVRAVSMTTRATPALGAGARGGAGAREGAGVRGGAGARTPGIATLRPDGVLCLRFDSFDAATAAWVRAELKARAHAGSMRAVVLDLRLNGGGTVSACRRVLGEFFSASKTKSATAATTAVATPVKAGVFIDRRARPVAMEANVSRFGANYRGPLVVLVARMSASGAEVFASAIQASGRGAIVGMSSTGRTAGAVLMSMDFALPGGGELQVPVRDYVSASGARLEMAGVRADVDAPLPTVASLRAGEDPAMEIAAKVALGR